MSDLEHGRYMLSLARRDLKALRGMLDPDVFDEAVFGFHAQQAVEKSVKAWLSLVGAAYPKTHDLEELFAILKEQGVAVPEEFAARQSLTKYAVFLRYEITDRYGEALDRPGLIEGIEKLVGYVHALIEEEQAGLTGNAN